MEVKTTIEINGKAYSREEAIELYYALGKELGMGTLEIVPNREPRIHDFGYWQPYWVSPITCNT